MACNGTRGSGFGSSFIRGFGADEAETQVRRRMEAVHHLGASPRDIARALRQARKSAFGPLGSYDPVAHAALVRLAKAARRRSGDWGPPRETGRPPQSSPRRAPPSDGTDTDPNAPRADARDHEDLTKGTTRGAARPGPFT